MTAEAAGAMERFQKLVACRHNSDDTFTQWQQRYSYSILLETYVDRLC